MIKRQAQRDNLGLYFSFKSYILSLSFTAPGDHELRVRNLSAGVFIEDEESNTFSVKFSWQSPSFKHSNADTYAVSYKFDGGYPRNDLSCSPLQRDNKGCSQIGLVS